ncbi:hypothetical protein GCM10018793_47340 [Streptomyces sulfonofaciens]|uniref:Iron-containing redox enzyme family protein n=1 Tax=Streptomyces sulfonofaciens TaxID=68272 RepID=A0A919GHE8_9ACTN|nr:iron-containing redox enzyme family protein [Streptomyces sulfonofaciens]GHH84030.1 hypothetical protein GCM10018793_47340 [Streptomyces sulfonofaciens]
MTAPVRATEQAPGRPPHGRSRTAGPPGGPPLPGPRGELSGAVRAALVSPDPDRTALPGARETAAADPYGDDLQLALYLLYELHYRGFAGVGPDREWDARLLGLRARLERCFEAALHDAVPRGADVTAALDALLVEPAEDDGTDISRFLSRAGSLGHLREYAAFRSLYHLKEADPHAWVIPRLRGRAKAAMVAVEYDEFGAGRAEGVHAELFAALMADLGLDPAYGRYLDRAPAAALATVNLMSLFGLHRAHRGALVGHFASVEVTSSPASARLAAAMRRTGAGPAAEHFYTEHVEADAVHEQVVRREVVDGLLTEEPDLAADLVFGIRATGHLDRLLAAHALPRWRSGRTALRSPL